MVATPQNAAPAHQVPHTYPQLIEDLVGVIKQSCASFELPAAFDPTNPELADEEDPEFRTLFDSLSRAVTEEDGFFENVSLDYLRIEYSVLMIRQAYVDLTKLIFTQGPEDAFLILGSPGTGKTVFLLFTMALLIKAGEIIEPETGEARSIPFAFKFRGCTGVYLNSKLHFMKKLPKELNSSNFVFLYDDKEEVPYIFPKSLSIVFSSPQKPRYKEYAKGGTIKYYMPMWSDDEVIRLNAHLPEGRGRLGYFQLGERYNKAGGVPRWIFQDWDEFEAAIGSGLEKVKPDYLAADSMNCFEAGPHSLIGIEVETNLPQAEIPMSIEEREEAEKRRYRQFQVVFRTEELAARVYDHCFGKKGNFIDYVAQNTDIFPKYGSRLGLIFQAFAMHEFAKGFNREMEFISLNEEADFLGSPWVLYMPPATKNSIRSFTEVNTNLNGANIWIPKSWKFPVVDYFFTLQGQVRGGSTLILGLKMTKDIRHGINYPGLLDLYRHFNGNFVLVWVLNGDIFDRFQVQSQKTNRVIVSPNLVLPVPQFKFKVYAGDFKLPEG